MGFSFFFCCVNMCANIYVYQLPIVRPILAYTVSSIGSNITRMHSSRMRTVRYSGRHGVGGRVYPSTACTGQGVSARGCLPSGYLLGGCLPRGVSAQGGVFHIPPSEQNHGHLWKNNFATTMLRTVIIITSMHSSLLTVSGGRVCIQGVLPTGELGRHPLWTEWHKGVKALPCPKLRLRAVIIIFHTLIV